MVAAMAGQGLRTRAGENYFTEEEERKLFGYLRRRKDWQAVRDYALLRLGRATGLRRTELCALNVGDVYGKDLLEVNERIAAKGAVGKVHIPKDIQALIRWYLRLKRQRGESIQDAAPLFCSRLGGRIGEQSLNNLMEKWCGEAGIPRFTPHALRHTKGQRIMGDVRHLNDEERARALQFANRQLRHKSLSSTLIYTVPTKEQMEKVGAI